MGRMTNGPWPSLLGQSRPFVGTVAFSRRAEAGTGLVVVPRRPDCLM